MAGEAVATSLCPASVVGATDLERELALLREAIADSSAGAFGPSSMTWQIDGVRTCQTTSFVPTTPMFMIIDTAVGGVGGGAVKNSTLPQTTEVDYVKVT